MTSRRVEGRFGGLSAFRLPVLLAAALGFIATLAFEAHHRHAELVESVGLRAEHLSEKVAKRSTVVELFASLAQESRDYDHLREQARQITKSVGGWLVIAKPGVLMDIEFISLGDGRVPPPVSRFGFYAPLMEAERNATISGTPAVSDIFVGQKSGVPTVSIVTEADLPQGTRYVYLSLSVSDLVDGLARIASPQVSLALVDGRGKRATPEHLPGQHALPHIDVSLAHRLTHFTHDVRVFDTWTLYGEEPVLGTDSVSLAAMVAAILGLLTQAALGATLGAAGVRVRSAQGGRGGPDDRDGGTREQLGLVLTLGHELRSPLISLLSAIDLVKRNPNETATAFLDHATQEAHSLLRLIDDMLACAKISADGIAVNEEIYSPLDLLQTCVRTVSAGVGTSCPIVIDGCPGGEPLVGDSAKIRQILLNFLSNAVKCSGGRKVEIGCRIVAQKGDVVTIRFSVTDKGIGIPESHRKDVFWRAATGAGPSGMSGNGIGLLTSRLLAEAMGGRVGFDSVEGRGSTFWVEVTQRKVSVAASLPVAVSPARLTDHISVLLSEDDPIIRLTIAHDLERAGARVESVKSGEEALQALEFDHFDVVLTDIRMEGLSGIDLAAEIRRTIQPPPLLVGISAHYAQAEDVAPSGVFDVVMEKPFSIASFTAQVAVHPSMQGLREHDGTQMAKVLAAVGNRRVELIEDITHSMATGLELCLTTDDLAKVGETAHRLAGLMLTLGARSIGRKLLAVETRCQEGKAEEARAAVREAKADMDRLLAALDRTAA